MTILQRLWLVLRLLVDGDRLLDELAERAAAIVRAELVADRDAVMASEGWPGAADND